MIISLNEARIKTLSKMVHESNKALCEELGDKSQKPWNEAPGYNHMSAMAGIQAVLDNPEITPSQIHDVWMIQKQADGWVHGKTKDRDKKTHPSIVPYEQLSSTEQYKDYLVIYIVKSYLDYLDHNKPKSA
jgi:hypothetical protein